MNPRWLSFVVPALLSLAPFVSHAADTAAPQMLADSTTAERWTLANGLQVTSRHIPGAQTVAIVLGYRVGSDLDPAGQEGMAQLLAELLLTAPTESAPARTAEEMNRLRPEGWDLQAGPHFTTLLEIASPAQVPGVLNQFAARLRGVNVTQAGLKATIASVQGELGQRYFGAPSHSLYYQVRELGLHSEDEITMRKASGKGIEKISLKQAQDRLRQLYVPANAVLSIAGGFDETQLHALIESQFGGIKAGTPGPAPAPSKLSPYARVIKRTELKTTVGVIAVISPPITDPNHPVFYLGIALLGGLAKDLWKPTDLVPSRFRYSLFGDPDLALFFPETWPGDQDTDEMSARFNQLIVRLKSTVVDESSYRTLRESLRWQLGAALPPRLLERSRNESAVLGTLATAMASRSLYLGEPFWEGYLQRLDAEPSGAFDRISQYVDSREHQVRLLFHPGR